MNYRMSVKIWKMKRKIRAMKRFFSDLKDEKSDYRLRINNFFDLKYRKQRKEQKKYAEKNHVMQKAPVARATSIDEKNMSRGQMKCIKLKSGRIVVTAESIEKIRKNPMYEGAEIVESRIKSDNDLD